MKVPVMCCVSFTEVKQNSDIKHQFKVCDFDIEDNNITNLVMFDKFKDIIKTLVMAKKYKAIKLFCLNMIIH